MGDQPVSFFRPELAQVAGVAADTPVHLTQVVEDVALLHSKVSAVGTPAKHKGQSWAQDTIFGYCGWNKSVEED